MDAKRKLFIALLIDNHHSVTNVRRMVFEALLSNEPVSIKGLSRDLTDRIDRSSIYRTLRLFENLGIVKRIHIGWKHTFELSEIFSNHHHHATCLRCGNIVHFEESTIIEQQLIRLTDGIDFEMTEHSLELRGICSVCKHGAGF